MSLREASTAAEPVAPAPMIYAGFWRRLEALLVDVAVFLPLAALQLWLFRSRTLLLLSTLLLTALGWAYQIWMHGRWGQTLGKMATGVRVVSVDGASISWRQAFLRSAVTVGLGVLASASFVYAVLQIPKTEFQQLGFLTLSRRIQDKQLWPFLRWVQNAWLWSEVIVMLFNSRRRSIHDYIAGTVVLRCVAAPETNAFAAERQLS